jgi:hypothetical protein
LALSLSATIALRPSMMPQARSPLGVYTYLRGLTQ